MNEFKSLPKSTTTFGFSGIVSQSREYLSPGKRRISNNFSLFCLCDETQKSTHFCLCNETRTPQHTIKHQNTSNERRATEEEKETPVIHPSDGVGKREKKRALKRVLRRRRRL